MWLSVDEQMLQLEVDRYCRLCSKGDLIGRANIYLVHFFVRPPNLVNLSCIVRETMHALVHQ